MIYEFVLLIYQIDFDLAKNLSTKLEIDVDNGLNNRPELRILKIQNNQENNNLLQAKNLYQPKLDLQLEASKDLGDGTKSRSQSNNQVKLDFELPLQQNIAKGKIASSSSKIKAIKYEEQFYRDKISTEISQLHNSLKNILQIYANYLEELKLSLIYANKKLQMLKSINCFQSFAINQFKPITILQFGYKINFNKYLFYKNLV